MKPAVIGSVTSVIGRIPILDVEPVVECGGRPAKAVVGETFQVSATVFREGHGLIGVGAVLRDPERNASQGGRPPLTPAWPARSRRCTCSGPAPTDTART